MKCFLVAVTVLLSITTQVNAAEQGMRMSIIGESMEHGEASSLAITSEADVFYGGLSVSYIHSSKVIQYSQRKTIYPVYVFFGLKAPWKVTPYVEAGFDLGGALINDLYETGDKDTDLVDYYYAGGLRVQLNGTVSLLVFAKQYSLKYREFVNAPTEKNRPDSYGMGLSFRF